MEFLPYLPFPTLALLMLVDELAFHRARGLGTWETFGHPIDTLSALFPLLWLLAARSPSSPIYIALCVLSCLLVTKDEFVHFEHGSPGEQWLHSLLFILHPTSFFAAAELASRGERDFLAAQALLTALFCVFQILIWGTSWAHRSSAIRSTTRSTTTTATAGTQPTTTP